MKRILAALVLLLSGLNCAAAETLWLTCAGGMQLTKLRIDSAGAVEMNGRPYKPDAFSWQADAIAFRIPVEEKRFMARWTFHQEWVIDRASGEAKYAFLGRSKTIATYRCRDSVTSQPRF